MGGDHRPMRGLVLGELRQIQQHHIRRTEDHGPGQRGRARIARRQIIGGTILTDSLGKLRAHYVAQPGDAAALLGVGDSKSDEKLPKSELAAWTMVCSQLLNLDEILNK